MEKAINNENYADHPLAKQEIVQWWNENPNIPVGEIEKDRKSINKSNYLEILTKFMVRNEGFIDYGYPDGSTGYSIGYGLFFKKTDSTEYVKRAVNLFDRALKIPLYDFIPIQIFKEENVKELLKSYRLSESQCKKLLTCMLEEDVELIKRDKINYFENLPLNMKVTIQSLYYNNPVLLGPNFMSGLDGYKKSEELHYLIKCLYEIEKNSNLKNNEFYAGVQNRRMREGLMFSNRILDLHWRVPDEHFEAFLNLMQKDELPIHGEFLEYYQLYCEQCSKNKQNPENITVTIKQALLEKKFNEQELPDLTYIAQKLKELHS